MNALLLIATVLGLIAAAVLVLVALRIGRRALARRVGVVAVAAAALYGAVLVSVNLASVPRVLRLGEREAFCGVYIDCHLGLAAERVETAQLAGRPVAVVTLRLSSDAVQATLWPDPLTLRVVDAAGRAFSRDPAAERALGLAPDLHSPLEAGASRAARVAFRLPPDAPAPRLQVGLGDPVERVAQGLLIGDVNGLFHAPVTHALNGVPRA